MTILHATPYALAAAQRMVDRPRCHWPEIGLIGNASTAAYIATAAGLRRSGIAVATYIGIPLRRQAKRAAADDADYMLFVDGMKMIDRITGSHWFLDPTDPIAGAVFAVNCGYLPLDPDSP